MSEILPTLALRKANTLLESFLRKGIETGIVVTSKDNKLNLSFTDQYIIDTNNQTVEQSIEVIRKRVDESGTKEPIIQKQGADNQRSTDRKDKAQCMQRLPHA